MWDICLMFDMVNFFELFDIDLSHYYCIPKDFDMETILCLCQHSRYTQFDTLLTLQTI